MEYEEMQKYYDKGYTVVETCLKFRISESSAYRASKRGQLKFRNHSESMKISCEKKPRKHTEETKKKISQIRKKYLKENPDKVPYLLNHSSKESYPEKYFNKIFKNEKINTKRYHQIGLYQLDFCILESKIDIEIDGEQHYSDIKIVESDKRRNQHLENLGWKILRIRWSHYKKLNKEDRTQFIKNLINKLK